jgi:photosystem II biogenesis protein Psp29
VSAPQTVADSKRAFHAAFPHVIGPLYRRMVDELLVELHLLSHQRGFQADPLFAVGTVQVFQAFARGYRPDQHREPLFDALCQATGFDAGELRRLSEEALGAVGAHSVEEVKGWIPNKRQFIKKKWMAEWYCEAKGWKYRVVFRDDLETLF